MAGALRKRVMVTGRKLCCLRDGIVWRYYELSGTPRFEGFGKVQGWIDGAEVGHARKIELEMIR